MSTSTGIRTESGPGSGPGGDRPQHRGRWILVAVLSALFIVTPLVFGMYGEFFGREASHSSVETNDHHPVRAVQIDSGSAAVTIGPGADGEVRVKERLSWSLRKPKVTKVWDGDTLRLRPECGGLLSVTGLDCSVQLDLTVPAGVELNVKSGSGTVRVSGLTGPVDVRAGSGSVKLYGVRGPITGSVDSGSFSGSAIGSASAEMRVRSGQASLEFVTPPRRVSASSGSGSVEVSLPPGSRYRVAGSVGSGARDVDDALVDPASDRLLTISTGSGAATARYASWN
ncbi:hypothetical protein [Streptomyces sp. CBMA152]|uniref:hypothetical protein n=1 Tax=Streptomyces sp. CBMA152 TaxID=1896312 RepID=UPI0016616613|nr:hypothetical protein [Streptomyces sp. CBMA152]MBD0747209.1 hypothetical protein [Streptomyces sp. CBMA152]